MPKSNKNLPRTYPKGDAVRRAVIAEAITGKSESEIAASVGVSRPRVSQVINEPGVKLQISALFEKHAERIEHQFERVLDSLDSSFDLPVELFPAHSAARGDYIKLLRLAQPKQEASRTFNITQAFQLVSER